MNTTPPDTSVIRPRDEHVRLMLAQVPCILWTTDPALRCTHGLGAGLDWLGPRQNVGTEMSLYDYFKTDDPSYPPLRAHQTALQGESVTFELEWQGRSLEASVEPLRDGEGNIVGTTGIAIDVTERKQAERALRESHSLLKAVCEGTSDAVFVKDLEGRYLMINSAGAQFLGRSVDEVVGHHDTELFSGDTVYEVLKSDRRVLSTGKTVTREERITAAGITRTYSATKAVFRNEQGQIAGLIGISRDITEKKEAEEALRRSETQLRALIEAEPECVKLVAQDGTLLQINRTGLAMLGDARAEDVLGKSVFGFVAPGSRERFKQFHERVCGGEAAVLEFEMVRADGTPRWMETHAVPLAVEGCRDVKHLSVARDITERREAEAALRRIQEQLQQAQKMEAVGRLAGGVAHDFNNMLAVINGYSELLLQRYGGDPMLATQARAVLDAGRRAAELTQQLLTFSRQQMVAPKVLDLNASVESTEGMLRRLIGEDIELTTRLAPDLGSIRADSSQIDQVLLNLAVNARDAMPTGGHLTIETRNVELDAAYCDLKHDFEPGAYVLLAVTDDGCGMDAATRDRIFEPFFTTKELGSGTGLGLATVHGIVHQNGGHILIYSEPGHGTAFKLYFPRLEGPLSPGKPDEEQSPARGTETVLLVEDEPLVRNLGAEILRAAGYTVLVAGSGQEALQRCAESGRAPALVLTDVVMPKMSGRELKDRLRAIYPEIAVLYMSGYTNDAVVRHGILENDVAFLHKPFTPTELTRKVRLALKGDRK